jgi:hypothetical protein
MKLRIAEPDLYFDKDHSRGKRTRGVPFPWVKYHMPRSVKAAKIRQTVEGCAAIAVFHDVVLHASAGADRTTLSDGEGQGYSMDDLVLALPHSAAVLAATIPLLLSWGWLVDEEAPAVKPSKVIAMRKEEPLPPIETPNRWERVADWMTDQYLDAGADRNKLTGVAQVATALMDVCALDESKLDTIEANFRAYLETTKPQVLEEITNWLRRGRGFAKLRPRPKGQTLEEYEAQNPVSEEMVKKLVAEGIVTPADARAIYGINL